MENCTIYSHHIAFDKVVQTVQSSLPKANIEYKDGGSQKSLVATVNESFFGKDKTLIINYRQRRNPSHNLDEVTCGLAQNLAGMVNFVQSIPAKNKGLKAKFIHKVMSTNSEMSFMAKPEITVDIALVLKKIIAEVDGFVFAEPSKTFNRSSHQHFTDQRLKLILDTQGNSEITDIDVVVEAKYHHPPFEKYNKEQLDRKSKSESMLMQHMVHVNKNLPCIVSSLEVKIRNGREITDRAYALLITAAKGEGVGQQHLDRIIREKKITSFSPKESKICFAERLSEKDKVYATWRYESLYVMLWALGKVEGLKYPDDICDVKAIVGSILEPTREEFENTAMVKNTTIILDELDVTYRMNWACVDAKVKSEPITTLIDPSVVHERHYALNWLTNYQNQEWDDVSTNT